MEGGIKKRGLMVKIKIIKIQDYSLILKIKIMKIILIIFSKHF